MNNYENINRLEVAKIKAGCRITIRMQDGGELIVIGSGSTGKINDVFIKSSRSKWQAKRLIDTFASQHDMDNTAFINFLNHVVYPHITTCYEL